MEHPERPGSTKGKAEEALPFFVFAGTLCPAFSGTSVVTGSTTFFPDCRLTAVQSCGYVEACCGKFFADFDKILFVL